jgi:hypothetical protein
MFSSAKSLPNVQIEFNSFGVRTKYIGNTKVALFPINSQLKFTLLANETGDATVYLQGKQIGVYRLNANERFKIERPGEKDIGLYINKADSKESKQCGITLGDKTNGEFKIVFTPGRTNMPRCRIAPTAKGGYRSRSAPTAKGGKIHEACFLGKGTTGQQFEIAPKLISDNSRQVVICIRVGIVENEFDSYTETQYQSIESCLHGDTDPTPTISELMRF